MGQFLHDVRIALRSLRRTPAFTVTVLATIALGTPPFSLAAGVLTTLGVPLSATASAGGTAAKAELRDNAGTVVRDGLTVGTSGTNIIITNTTIAAGDEVRVTAATITHG